jgi:hypothetical protein
MRGVEFTDDGEFHVLESLVDHVITDVILGKVTVLLKSGVAVIVDYGKVFRWTDIPCNEVAWWADQRPLAVCTQSFGTAHSHSDHTAREAVELGLARPVIEDDVMHTGDLG